MITKTKKLSPTRAMPEPPKLNPTDYAMIGPEDLPLTSDGVKLLVLTRLFWLRRRRVPTIGETRALLKWGRTRVYEARSEIERKSMLRLVRDSGPQSEIADQQSGIADQGPAKPVRDSGPAGSGTRMDTGDSRRLETPLLTPEALEETEKKKSARRHPLPDFFPDLVAGLDKLNDWERKMVTNLAATPDALITAAQITTLTKLRALVKLPAKKENFSILNTKEEQDEASYEFALKIYGKGHLRTLDNILEVAREIGISEEQARTDAAKAREKGGW